jgi:hypothetical protein
MRLNRRFNEGQEGALSTLLIAIRRFANISKIEMQFDGCGDSGSFSDEYTVCCGGVFHQMTGHELNKELISSLGEVRARSLERLVARYFNLYEGGEETDVVRCLDVAASLALSHAAPGWEINEGSVGGVTFYTSAEAAEMTDFDPSGFVEHDEDGYEVEVAGGDPAVCVCWQERNAVPWTAEAMPDMADEIAEFYRLCEALPDASGGDDAAVFTEEDEYRLDALRDQLSDAAVNYEGDFLSDEQQTTTSLRFNPIMYAVCVDAAE